MCLINPQKKWTYQTREIYGYKIICVSNTPKSLIYYHDWQKGVNKSDRGLKRNLCNHEKKNKEVYKGFHIYLNLSDAKDIFEYKRESYTLGYNLRLIKVLCRKRNFVASGTSLIGIKQAVFTEVEWNGEYE